MWPIKNCIYRSKNQNNKTINLTITIIPKEQSPQNKIQDPYVCSKQYFCRAKSFMCSAIKH